MLHEADTTPNNATGRPHRGRRVAWLAAGAIGLAVVGAGAVQAQRYNDEGSRYGDSQDGDHYGERRDERGARSDRDSDRYERGDRGERFGRGERQDRFDRGDRAERRERFGHRHSHRDWRKSGMDRLRAYCSSDNERHEPSIRLYIKADLRLNKDQETAFDQLADTVMPAVADMRKARCDNLDNTAMPTPPERLQRRATMLRKMADVAEKAVDPLNKFYASLDDTQKGELQRVLMRRDRGLAAAVFGSFGGHMRGHAHGRWHRGDGDASWKQRTNSGDQQPAPKADDAQPSKP